MKKGDSFFLSMISVIWFSVILSIEASAIQITEFESNPAGSDSGNEWIELYSDEKVNLESWKLENNDEDVLELDKEFSGYLVIEFEKQWLDNKDEKVILRNSNNEIIDETDVFDDSKNNDKTWQICENNWIFVNMTKNNENNCEEQEENEEEQENEEDGENEEENSENEEKENDEDTEKEDKENEKENTINTETNSVKTESIIRLGSKKKSENTKGNSESDFSKTIYKSASEKAKKYAIYIFNIILIILVLLLIKKKM